MGLGSGRNEGEGHIPLNAYRIVPSGDVLDKWVTIHFLRRNKAFMQLSDRVMLGGDSRGSIKRTPIMSWNGA